MKYKALTLAQRFALKAWNLAQKNCILCAYSKDAILCPTEEPRRLTD